ncbi:MAG TPA: alpha/beta hydrolase [Planctomycetaceae bacterium]|jgi:endo-1,4-beta-xylanase|nr:alpha/beta hydrolase [Planctomycetaceae bacterium]
MSTLFQILWANCRAVRTRVTRPLLCACLIVVPASWLVADDKPMPPVVPLWSQGAPGSEGRSSEEKIVGKVHHHYVSNIHHPSLTVFLPPQDKANGAALVICPGGGHRFLSIDHEGYDLARWLNDQGVAGFVLKYRLANEPDSKYKVDVDALADARRAIRLVRSRASEWGVDPARVGLLGFSAGGELAMLAGTKSEKGRPDAADPIDRLDSRPDFLVLIYPGFRSGSLHVTKETPPTFLAVADDDRFCAPASVEFYQALKQAGVSGELHIYARGGHGFGMENRPLPVTSWTARLRDWLADRGYLKPRG